MRSLIARFLLPAAILSSCLAPTGGPTDPASIRPLLAGTWTCKTGAHGIDAYLEKTFNPDGTAHGFIDIRSGSGNIALLVPRVPFQSRWRFDADGYLVTYDVRCSVEGFFDDHFTTRDKVLRASPQRIDFVDVDTGKRFSFRRKTAPVPAPTTWSL
jgi:hypothetical protein